jgi:hypothetical protein
VGVWRSFKQRANARMSLLPCNARSASTRSSSTRSLPGSCLGVSDVRATRRTEAIDKRRPGDYRRAYA